MESKKFKLCIRCGNRMEEGMLPGWWICRECVLLVDVQESGSYQLIQYGRSIEVPQGTLLVLESKEVSQYDAIIESMNG